MADQLSRAVAAEVARLIADRSMSGRALARLTGIPPASMTRKLAGDTAFDLDDLQAISTALEVDVRDLLSWATG